jgi:glyoxylase-like metal-dependent hydrolase (beta-lactamase superfamily II)
MSAAKAEKELPQWEPRSVTVGPWRITALSDGYFRLDGGSMWGVVPQNIWRKLTPPAPDNTILLGLRPFLAEREGLKVVIEVGIGDRWENKWRDIYHLGGGPRLEESLAACGVAPEQVTHVLASHCHFDHIGAVVCERAGKLLPRFPAARHLAPAAEIERARHPDHARAASYRWQDLEAVENAGLLEAFDSAGCAQGRELLPDLWAHTLGGHSEGVSLFTLGSCGVGQAAEGRETAIFWADVVPTTHHIQPSYIMAYDIDVVRSFEVRSEWLARAAAGAWTGLFYHDPIHAFGRLGRDGKRYEVQPLLGDASEVGRGRAGEEV